MVVVTDIKLSLVAGEELQRALDGLKQKMEAARREGAEGGRGVEGGKDAVGCEEECRSSGARMDNPGLGRPS